MADNQQVIVSTAFFTGELEIARKGVVTPFL